MKINENIETPYYYVDRQKFYQNCKQMMDAFSREWGNNVWFGYSVKTNHDSVLIKYANEKLNWMIETVSADEYQYCGQLGINKNNMILNGPCKKGKIWDAYEGDSYINLDNYDEVAEFCSFPKKNTDRVGLRINFDLEKECPEETMAGEKVSRFGIDCESGEFREILVMLKEHGVDKIGLHMHVSTISRSLKVFRTIAEKVVELTKKFSLRLSYIDIGGGFFGGQIIQGKPLMSDYAETICKTLKECIDPNETKLILEPGASVLATCISYITKVANVREIRGTRIVTLDGSALHVNPFLVKRNQPYQIMTDKNGRKKKDLQIIAGCTCMEKDWFGEIENETELQCGDTLSFENAGAYTMAFNSNFIIRPPRIVYSEE